MIVAARSVRYDYWMKKTILTLSALAFLAPLTALGAAGDADLGGELFDEMGCGLCHTLAAAGAEGQIGPSFDDNPNLSEDLIISRVTSGQGAMPSFSGQLSDEEIEAIAAYLLEAAE